MESEKSDTDEKRLWIGNLDPRVTEYQLLKLIQKYGNIEKFDLLFHRNGPLAGQPRGYAFVTYTKKEDALKAKELNNTLVGSKNIIVTWAHSMPPVDDQDKPKKNEMNIPALAIAKNEKKSDREYQIQAIEAKLKLMERQNSSKELEINKTVASERSIISQYQFNKQQQSNPTNTQKYKQKKNDRPAAKPYDKCKKRN